MSTPPIPDNYVRVRFSYVASSIVLLISMGIAVGGYRAMANTQEKQISEARQDLTLLRADVARMHADFAALNQSVEDLKNVLITNQSQQVTILQRRQQSPVNVTVNPPGKK